MLEDIDMVSIFISLTPFEPLLSLSDPDVNTERAEWSVSKTVEKIEPATEAGDEGRLGKFKFDAEL